MNLIYATTNKHKLAGAKQVLAGTDINLIAPDGVLPDVPEIQSDDQAAVSSTNWAAFPAFTPNTHSILSVLTG